MGIQNDRLKGEFYRAPMTKLASRSNVITQINELIEYFNGLSDLIDNTFDRITVDRERMTNILNQINNKTRHFKYIIENFEPEISQHVEEKLASLMGTLSTNLNTVVTEYNKNLFNHNGQTDSTVADDIQDLNSLEEWDRSINHISNSMGIRWFGGKLSDKFFINQFNSVLHLVKVNTTDKHNVEDTINGNIIFEIFISTKNGMTWLVLGQDGNFGYNLVTKYQSKTNNIDLKLVSKNYFTPKTYDINKFDLDCIIDTLLTQDDISGQNVYINVKTNIPSNSYSGREGYYISKSKSFLDEVDKHSVNNVANKLMYHDNKDITYVKQENNDIEDVKAANIENISTNYIINPKNKKSSSDSSNTDKLTKFYSEIKNQITSSSASFTIEDKNNSGVTMINNAEKVNGRVINPENYIAVNEKYLENINLQSRKYDKDTSVPVYNSGEQIEDLFDYRTIGKVQPILQNESMFEVDGAIGGNTAVISGDIVYGESKDDITLSNKLYNNSSFDDISANENSFSVLHKYTDSSIDNTINEIKQTTIGTLAATNMGIYNFTKNAGIMAGSNDISFNCIFEASDGTIYAGTKNDNGIYYWNDENKIWELTNIRRGSISTFVEDTMGYIFAIANDGGNSNNEPEFDPSSLSYKTVNSIYRGKTPTSFYAFEDMLNKGIYDKDGNPVTNVDSFNRDCYYWTDKLIGSWFIKSSAKNKKAFFNYNEDRWYVYNPESMKLFVSVDNYFYKFKLSNIHTKYSFVSDVVYNDDKMYVSVIDSNNKSYVIEYKNGEERRIKLNDEVIKNNRKIIKHNKMLATFEDLNFGKE
jgi:hypothetical protein